MKHALARKSFGFRVWQSRGKEFSKKGGSRFADVRVFGRRWGSSFGANKGPLRICIFAAIIAEKIALDKRVGQLDFAFVFSIAIGPILAVKACI